MDAVGSPEGAEPGAAVGDEIVGGHRRVPCQADGGLDTLTVVRTGSGECRCLDDIGMGVKCIIDLPGRDVLASLEDGGECTNPGNPGRPARAGGRVPWSIHSQAAVRTARR